MTIPFSPISTIPAYVSRLIFIICLLPVLSTQPVAALSNYQSKIDSLRAALRTAIEDTNKVKILNALSEELNRNEPLKSLDYSQKALELSIRLNYQVGISASYNDIGIVQYFMGNYAKALNYYEKSKEIRLRLGHKSALSAIHTNIASVYINQGNYPGALENYLVALKLDQESGAKSQESRDYNNIGLVYFYQKDYKSTLGYFSKSVKIKEALNDRRGLASSYNNISEVYRKLDNLPLALEYNFKSLAINNSLNDKQGISRSLINIGLVYAGLKNYPMAMKYYTQALKIKDELNDRMGKTLALMNIGELYTEQKNYGKAIDYYNESISIAQKLEAWDILMDCNASLAELFEQTGNIPKSYQCYKLYTAFKDSVSGQESKNKLAELQMRYESEQKESEIELLNKDKLLNEAEIKKQTFLRNSFIIGFLSVLIAILFIYRNYRLKKKTGDQLAVQNQLIMQKNEEIRAQADQLELSNIELEKLSVVAKETSNAVAIMDEHGDIEWVNVGFNTLYGYDLDNFTGARGKNLTEASSNPGIAKILDQCVTLRTSVYYECQTTTKDGRKLWIKTALTPIFDKSGVLRKIIAIDTDFTAIKEAGEEIRKINKSITDSIYYAKRIQDAILVSKTEIQKHLPGLFIFLQPRDIVSGDFYWFSKVDGKILLAAVDCTGHGVPGAFMSMIGNELLNEIVNEKHILTPSRILEALHAGVRQSLSQQSETETMQNDGMDISVCCIDPMANEVTLSCSHQTVCIVKNGEFTTVEGDLFSIGDFMINKIKLVFKDHKIEAAKGATIYMFTDGYHDQFGSPRRSESEAGGTENRKFSLRRMKEMFSEIHKLGMQEQYDIISKTFNDWKGSVKQTDDVLVIGFKV